MKKDTREPNWVLVIAIVITLSLMYSCSQSNMGSVATTPDEPTNEAVAVITFNETNNRMVCYYDTEPVIFNFSVYSFTDEVYTEYDRDSNTKYRIRLHRPNYNFITNNNNNLLDEIGNRTTNGTATRNANCVSDMWFDYTVEIYDEGYKETIKGKQNRDIIVGCIKDSECQIRNGNNWNIDPSFESEYEMMWREAMYEATE
jgi:hypothetical protein